MSITITKSARLSLPIQVKRKTGSGLLWNENWFRSDAVVIFVSRKSTGFLSLALRVRFFHRCIRPEFGVYWWLARQVALGVSVDVVRYWSHSLCSYQVHFCRSFRPPLFVGFPEGNQVFDAPEPICNASGHRRRHTSVRWILIRLRAPNASE